MNASLRALAQASAESVRTIQLAWNPPPGREECRALRSLRWLPAGDDGKSGQIDEGLSLLAKAAFDFGELFLAAELTETGLAEIARCAICLATGEWPARLHDVEEVDIEELRAMTQESGR